LEDWPLWSDRLPPAPGLELTEGGRRVRGELRAGTADEPLVTYVTVVRNNAAVIGRAIESVLQQTYGNVEHIILDGASTDGTLDVIERYAERVDYFASEPDAGVYAALNKAIALARGDLICVLNSDDWLAASAAAKVVSRFGGVSKPTLLMTAATARRRRAKGTQSTKLLTWHPAIVDPGCYFTCANACHNGIYATRSAYERSGPYDARYEIAGDFKWIMTCLDAGVGFVYARDVTVNYLLGGVSSDTERHALECIRVMRERFPLLTADEAGGLHHCFFRFRPASVPGGDEDASVFLRRVLARHSDDVYLVGAIACALLENAESVRPGIRVLVKELVKVALRGHPRLLRAAHRVYVGRKRV
jgi:Glycosyl transferase family 2